MQLPPLNRISFQGKAPERYACFDSWLTTEPGQALLKAERRILADWQGHHVGQRAVEVTVSRGLDLLVDSPLPWRTSIAPPGFSDCGIESHLESLPLARNSVDVLLLHHCLDFSADPHQVLREASQCVAPGGMLAVMGFQPLSLLGLARWCFWRHRPGWVGRFYRPSRVTDWLQVLGFEVDGMASGFYTAPLSQPNRNRLRPLEWFFTTLMPRHGGSYLLVSRKQAGVLRPLASRQRPSPTNTVVPVPVARWHKDTYREP